MTLVFRSGNVQRLSLSFSATTKDSRKREKRLNKSVESLKWLLALMFHLTAAVVADRLMAEAVDLMVEVVDHPLEVVDHPLVEDRLEEEIIPQKLVPVSLTLIRALEALRDPVEAFPATLTMTGVSIH